MGVTIFEAMTLGRPFQVPEHVTFSALPAFLASSPPRRPGEVRRGFPAELEAIILKAMARNPADRYDSAARFATDLRRIEVRWAFRSGRAPIDAPHGSITRGPHAAVAARVACSPDAG